MPNPATTPRHRVPAAARRPRWRGAVVALTVAAAGTLTGCATTTGPDRAPAPVRDQAAAYVDLFEEAGKVLDAVDAGQSWDVVTDAAAFNTYARWDTGPLRMTRFGLDPATGTMQFCVTDRSRGLYASAATATRPAPLDPSDTATTGPELTYAVGFGTGTSCHHDQDADVLLAIDNTGVHPVAAAGTARLAAAVAAELTRAREAGADTGSSGEAVVRHATLDLADDLADRPGPLPQTATTGSLADAGIWLPRGVEVYEYATARGQVTWCLVHPGAQVWSVYTAPTGNVAAGTVTVAGPTGTLCTTD